MYTQCSKCETVFKLSAEVLRAAGGQVRCGRCGEVFNALARLAEDASAFATGESALELEARADSILESAVALQVAQAAPKESDDFALPGVETAHLRVLDWDEENEESPEMLADTSMEFTLPPGELDRIFVEPKPKPRAAAPLPEVVADPERKHQPKAEPPPQNTADEEAASVAAPPGGVSGLEVSEDVRRQMLAGFAPPLRVIEDPAHIIEAAERRSARRRDGRRPFILWLSAAIASALLLGTQMVHQNREWLADHGPLGAGLRALYRMLGTSVPSPANLSAYQLRQWGVTGDPSASGTLRVRASIMNTAGQFQPYPLLRVSLANRFGSRIGDRDFEPAEYLGKPTVRPLAPGERADATLDILDPGKDAEGFEIDVCLRGPDQRISCQSDAAAQVKQ